MGKSGCAPPQQLRKATCDLSSDASHQALARASHVTAAAMRARITGAPSRIRRTLHGERRMNSAPAICGEPKWLTQPRAEFHFRLVDDHRQLKTSLSTFSRGEIHNGSVTCLDLAFSPVFRILHKNGFEPIRQKSRFFPSKKPESA